MKITLIYLLFILSMNVSSETTIKSIVPMACKVELFSKVYRLEASQALTSKDIVRSTDCEQSITNKLSQMISSSSGAVGADFLKRELAKDFENIQIEILPRKLSLLDLSSTLRDQLTTGSNLYFLDSKSLNGISSIGLVENEQIKMHCESCSSFGEKNIKIDIINPVDNSRRTLWFASRIMAKINVYKAKRNLSFQQKHLQSEDFYGEEIYTANPDNVVSSLSNINFFKANRTILQGAVVSNLDLQPVNLVNFGTPVNVVLKNNNINLQRTAMPVRSAQFGEVIELRNPNNNKIIAGKVVDYNKVVIEL